MINLKIIFEKIIVFRKNMFSVFLKKNVFQLPRNTAATNFTIKSRPKYYFIILYFQNKNIE